MRLTLVLIYPVIIADYYENLVSFDYNYATLHATELVGDNSGALYVMPTQKAFLNTTNSTLHVSLISYSNTITFLPSTVIISGMKNYIDGLEGGGGGGGQ